MDLFGPISKMDELAEREFYAIAVLNYCDIGEELLLPAVATLISCTFISESLNLPDEIIKSAERIRARTFEELQDYYKFELKLDDFSQRLGNLMTLAHGAGVSASTIAVCGRFSSAIVL